MTAIIPESKDGPYSDVVRKAKKILILSVLYGEYTCARDGDRDRFEGEMTRIGRPITFPIKGCAEMLARWMQQQDHRVTAFKATDNEDGTFTVSAMRERHDRTE